MVDGKLVGNPGAHMPSTAPPSLARFADFEVDVRAGQLRQNGVRIQLQDQPFRLLAALLESAGEPVTREELRSCLWPAGTFVDFDHRLAVAVSKLRDALKDSAESPKFVETLGRRGYRFMVNVEWVDRVLPSQPETSDVHTGAPEIIATLPGHRQIATRRGMAQSKRNRRLTLLVVAVALVLGSSIAIAKFTRLRQPKTIGSVEPRSLAILPLQNLRKNRDDDFLGFSLADAVITKLNYVSSLTVRPSAAVEKYRDEIVDDQSAAAGAKVTTPLP